MSQLPANVDLTAYRGDTWSQTFRFKRGNTAEDLTGATVESEARSATGRVQLVVDVDEPNGEVTISLPADTAADSYDYDVEVTMLGGTVQTWVKGRLIVNPDVTNEPA